LEFVFFVMLREVDGDRDWVSERVPPLLLLLRVALRDGE
jgi:hypothetical protein